MSYKTILNEATYEYEEKKSVFIGYIKRINNENSAREFIEKIKHKHSDARHNVYAYTLGKDMLLQRYTDDGEPQGTAGIPIIGVIKNNELKDVVIVVTRYFGGVLLGVGGLTRAYVNAASGAVKNSVIVYKVLGNYLKIKVKYDLVGKLQYYFKENDINIHNIDYEDNVIFHIRCEENQVESIKTNIINISSNNFNLDISDKIMYFKNKNEFYLENEI